MKKASILFTTALALSALLLSACKSTVAVDPYSGNQQSAYYQAGTLTGTIDTTPESAFRKVLIEIDKLGYFRTGELHKDQSITIYARKVGDEKVTVKLVQLKNGKTDVRIRVGMGNLAESQMIFAKIKNAI